MPDLEWKYLSWCQYYPSERTISPQSHICGDTCGKRGAIGSHYCLRSTRPTTRWYAK
jgi:hypothetical protein